MLTYFDISEYAFPFKNASLGVSEINWRYPQTGFDVDEEIEASWYVEWGNGIVWIDWQEYNVQKGDMIYVPANEKYYIVWNKLSLVVSSSPVWYPEQHKHIE